MANRLKLDFSLDTTEQRTQFIQTYIKSPIFLKKPPTSEELNTMADYILWGKNPDTGKNVKQEKIIELEARRKTWAVKELESLDALLENPSFPENQLSSLTSQPYKATKITFSREVARKEAPPETLKILESLWYEIDKLDLIINFYDLAHGKRKKPPRDVLLKKFSPAEIESIKTSAAHLNQYKYLKMRHLLVELRREQFTVRDSYTSLIQKRTIPLCQEPIFALLNDNITILPFGITNNTPLFQKIFNPARMPEPDDFTESELKTISNKIWESHDPSLFSVDFRNPNHLYHIFSLIEELKDEFFKKDEFSTIKNFLDTLNFYIEKADLTEIQKEILTKKVARHKNQDIAKEINKKYNKSYNINYISTIFKQKILKQISCAATQHYEIIQNLFFPENFKICRDCGRKLLVNSDNFIRKAKSKDGFSIRCKSCDKKKRQEK